MDNFSDFAAENLWLVLGLMISFFVLVFSELRRKASGLTAVDPTDAVGLINNDATVIDLRNAETFARGHVVNARNVPFDELDAHQDTLAQFMKKPIVAVCESGISSNKAAASLRSSGFESVYSLKGGMTAWSQAGLPVVTGKKTKSKRKK